MPTYDYECDACGHKFEKFQPITARSIRKCPQCAKLKVRRLIGIGAGVIFKGSGFYQTDYRSKSYQQAAEKDKKASSEAKKDSSTKKTAGDKTKTTDSGKNKASGTSSS